MYRRLLLVGVLALAFASAAHAQMPDLRWVPGTRAALDSLFEERARTDSTQACVRGVALPSDTSTLVVEIAEISVDDADCVAGDAVGLFMFQTAYDDSALTIEDLRGWLARMPERFLFLGYLSSARPLRWHGVWRAREQQRPEATATGQAHGP